MKKTTIILASLLAFVVATGCSSSSSDNKDLENALNQMVEDLEKPAYEAKEINDLYSIEVASDMRSTTILNDDASAQFMAGPTPIEKYIIVIDEEKETLLAMADLLGTYDYEEDASDEEKYAAIQFDNFTENASNILNDSGLNKIKGVDGVYRVVDAEVLGVPEPITYWLGYVSGKESLYYVMSWTLKKDKSDFEAEAMHMLESFKEM